MSDYPLIQRLDSFAVQLLQPGHTLDTRLQRLAESLDVYLDLSLLFLGKFLELLVINNLAFANRRKDITRRCLQYTDAFARRFGFEGLPLRLDFFFRLFLDGPHLIAIVIAFECGGNGNAHVLDQGVHVVTKLPTLAGRESQSAWPFRIREVVDVTPILGRPLPGGALVHEFPNKAVTMTTERAEYVNVVTWPLYLDTKSNRIDRTLLAQVGCPCRQFIAAHEATLERLAGSA